MTAMVAVWIAAMAVLVIVLSIEGILTQSRVQAKQEHEAVMAKIDDAMKSIADIKSAAQSVEAALAAQMQMVKDLREQIEGGEGATPEQMDELLAKMAEVQGPLAAAAMLNTPGQGS